jgi:Na+/H+-dicarboxylate symporter
MKQNKLTIYILAAMIAGIIAGIIINKAASPETIDKVSKNIKLLATIFIRMVQMIISPLVFTTLVVGIAKLGDIKAVGRVGGKALAWFITASLISLLLGMLVVNYFEPGKGMELGDINSSSVQDVVGNTKGFSLQNFVEHIVPKSVFEAMATNEILQLVVFSIFFGIALASMGEKAKPLIKTFDVIAHTVLKMVNYVMAFAPLGVFGAITAVIAYRGLDILIVYGKYFGAFLVGIILLWVLLIAAAYIFIGSRTTELLKRLYGPMVIAFSTTSSEAVFPKLTEELEKFGCDHKIVSFTLPLGYSFNLDGSMMYMTFASIFIAQAYGIHLDIGTQLTMLLVLMVSSKGVAGVPRASLVVVAATCGMFDIPVEGIALILPIDHFCDMFRSMTNVLGNAFSTVAVSKWEGELGEATENI